VIGRRAQSHY
jgi:hypothetical protein